MNTLAAYHSGWDFSHIFYLATGYLFHAGSVICTLKYFVPTFETWPLLWLITREYGKRVDNLATGGCHAACRLSARASRGSMEDESSVELISNRTETQGTNWPVCDASRLGGIGALSLASSAVALTHSG